MDRRTAQVVFLVDRDIGRHTAATQDRTISLLRLSCLRILSSFLYNSSYKELRWGFRFYSLDSLPLSAHRHTSWSEFSLQMFQGFEEALEYNLVSRSAAVKEEADSDTKEEGGATVKTPDSAAVKEQYAAVNDAAPVKEENASIFKNEPKEENASIFKNEPTSVEETPYFQKPPSILYSNILCAVIEDFQWEMPDISSPVKPARRTSALHAGASSSVQNFVFNFQLCPQSVGSLGSFIGGMCSTPSQLAKSLMSDSAKQKWMEKEIRLFWVDSTCGDRHLCEELTDLYRKALEEYNGGQMHISQIVPFRRSTDNLLLPAIIHAHEYPDGAPVVPCSQLLHEILQNSRTRKGGASLARRDVARKAFFKTKSINICTNNNEISLSLNITPLSPTGELPSIEYLYISGGLLTSAVRLEYLNQSRTLLCTSGESGAPHRASDRTPELENRDSQPGLLSLLLIELSANNSVMVLASRTDNTQYILRPLTINKATLTEVEPEWTAELVTRLRSNDSQQSPASTVGHDLFTGSCVEPTTQIEVTRGTGLSTQRSKRRAVLSPLQDTYRANSKLIKSELRLSTSAATTQVSGKRNAEEKESAPPAVIRSQLAKSGLFTRGIVAIQKVVEKKRVSTENISSVAVSNKGETPARKKIAITTVSTLGNVDAWIEEELLSYLNNSYEEACRGQSDVYLTARSLVNTARVFYKRDLNPQKCVEDFLTAKIIKSPQTIRKLYSTDPERKYREYKMSTLTILELEILKQELSPEDCLEDRMDRVVASLEEYLTAMSMGKPHILKEFFSNHLIPSYQLALAPLVAALLTEFGQDFPPSLKQFMMPELDGGLPSLSSVGSRRSSQMSPTTSMLPSLRSMFSEPDNSLMSSSMLPGGTRSLQIKSLSEVGRRSIAVPGELLKKRRKSRNPRRSDQGIAGRTRSKTPKKESEPFLTEFPVGFLARLKEGSSLSQPLPDPRRSPRFTNLHQPTSIGAPTKHRVKRDLFTSPSTASRRRMSQKSPRRRTLHEHQQSVTVGTAATGPDGGVLVAETPLHKQGQKISTLIGGKSKSNSTAQVVEESPARCADIESKTVSESYQRRLGRRTSFYDIESIKSRNLEKFEKLESRLKCNIGSRCSPRKLNHLIFKQALSQPTERAVTTRLPLDGDSVVAASFINLPAQPKLQRNTLGTDEIPPPVEPTKPRPLKKKLFTSPQAHRTLRRDLIIQETPEKGTDSSVAADPDGLSSESAGSPTDSLLTNPLREGHVISVHPAASRKRSPETKPADQVLETPTKSQSKMCVCGTPTRSPKHSRRSSSSSQMQQKVCLFAHSITSPELDSEINQEFQQPVLSSPSPKRLNFHSRKRGTDPLLQEMKSTPGGVRESEKTSYHRSPDMLLSPTRLRSEGSIGSVESPLLSPGLRRSPRSTLKSHGDNVKLLGSPRTEPAPRTVTPQRHKLLTSKTAPKYSPVTPSDICSLMGSPFVNRTTEKK